MKIVTKEIERKMGLIRERDRDGSLIFKSSSEDTLYTISELHSILKELIGMQLPKEQTIVQRKHSVTYKILESLGYSKPSGLRTTEARANKPKFTHQLMDIFIQKHSNLQVWNYIPYSRERYGCRYIIFKVDDRQILGLLIKSGREIRDWDTTGTKTIKWQATVTNETRKKAQGRILLSERDPAFVRFGLNKKELKSIESRIDAIKELQKEDKFLLAANPNPKLLVTIEELGTLLNPLLNIEIEYSSEKLLGQNFQTLVSERLGYNIDKDFSIDSGQFPDLIHQLIEAKVQISPTIDLGNHLPITTEPLPFDWNKNKISPSDIRYIIALADRTSNNSVRVKGIIVTSGEEFEQYFTFCEGTNFKVQLTIPNFDKI